MFLLVQVFQASIYYWCIKFQDEDGQSGEDGEGEVDLEEEPDQDKLWEEVNKGLTALQGKAASFTINKTQRLYCFGFGNSVVELADDQIYC